MPDLREAEVIATLLAALVVGWAILASVAAYGKDIER